MLSSVSQFDGLHILSWSPFLETVCVYPVPALPDSIELFELDVELDTPMNNVYRCPGHFVVVVVFMIVV